MCGEKFPTKKQTHKQIFYILYFDTIGLDAKCGKFPRLYSRRNTHLLYLHLHGGKNNFISPQFFFSFLSPFPPSFFFSPSPSSPLLFPTSYFYVNSFLSSLSRLNCDVLTSFPSGFEVFPKKKEKEETNNNMEMKSV